jgi:hypothetical protein
VFLMPDLTKMLEVSSAKFAHGTCLSRTRVNAVEVRWNGRAEDYQRLDMHLQKPTFSLGRVGGVHFHRLRRTSHHDVKRC